MNTKAILAASLAALAVGVSAPSVAATSTQDQSGGSSMKMQGEGEGMGSSMMGDGGSPHAMGGGMMEMMGGCPMAMGGGLDRKTAMRMHGEMMRAMGDILIKYADKAQEPAPKQ